MKKIMIDTPCGQMEGISDEEVRKFLGIRYATAGRWEYPKEITSWQGIYSALHFGAAPDQKRAYTTEISQTDGLENMSLCSM